MASLDALLEVLLALAIDNVLITLPLNFIRPLNTYLSCTLTEPLEPFKAFSGCSLDLVDSAARPVAISQAALVRKNKGNCIGAGCC